MSGQRQEKTAVESAEEMLDRYSSRYGDDAFVIFARETVRQIGEKAVLESQEKPVPTNVFVYPH